MITTEESNFKSKNNKYVTLYREKGIQFRTLSSLSLSQLSLNEIGFLELGFKVDHGRELVLLVVAYW